MLQLTRQQTKQMKVSFSNGQSYGRQANLHREWLRYDEQENDNAAAMAYDLAMWEQSQQQAEQTN